jgi:hypothetical protein
MRYAYVEDGVILNGPDNLPSSWNNISGFNLMPQEELIKLGWLPWRVIEPETQILGDDFVLGPPIIEIKSNEIVETPVYREKTQEEKNVSIQNEFDNNRRMRIYAYQHESDPIFFKAQRGEETMETWQNVINDIKKRYPTK